MQIEKKEKEVRKKRKAPLSLTEYICKLQNFCFFCKEIPLKNKIILFLVIIKIFLTKICEEISYKSKNNHLFSIFYPIFTEISEEFCINNLFENKSS